MAETLAKSLKRHEPGLPIQLVYEPATVRGCDLSAVDVKTTISPDHSRRGGKLNPCFAKLVLHCYYVWDHTMFLDVDAVCFAPFGDLFDSVPFKIFAWGETDQQDGKYSNMIWMEIAKMRTIFGLKGPIPGVNSSYQVSQSSDVYEQAIDLYYMFEKKHSVRDLQFPWGRKHKALPDELFFNAAVSKLGLSLDEYQENVVHFHIPKKKEITLAEAKEQGKRFWGIWGDKTYNGRVTQHVYDQLAVQANPNRMKFHQLAKRKFVVH